MNYRAFYRNILLCLLCCGQEEEEGVSIITRDLIDFQRWGGVNRLPREDRRRGCSRPRPTHDVVVRFQATS